MRSYGDMTLRPSRRAFLSGAGATALLATDAVRFGRAVAQSGAPINWFMSIPLYGDTFLFEPWTNETHLPYKQTLWTGADEMSAKMRAGASQLFDCVGVPQQFVPQLAKEGLIEPLDPATTPNFQKLFPEFKTSEYVNFDGKSWGAPFVYGANAIAYNKKQLAATDTLKSLFDPKFKGRISMRDDPEDSLPVAALYLGIEEPFKMTDNELQECKKLLVSQRPLIRAYWRNISDLQTMFANDEVTLGWSQLAPIAPLRKAGIDMGWVWPKEGALGFYVASCTVKGTARRTDAEKFGNYLMGPDYGARLGEKYGYATPSALAWSEMSDAAKAKVGINPSDLKLLKFKQLIPNRPVWQRIWDEVKAS
jgi:spermidine/putrescine-binding protein